MLRAGEERRLLGREQLGRDASAETAFSRISLATCETSAPNGAYATTLSHAVFSVSVADLDVDREALALRRVGAASIDDAPGLGERRAEPHGQRRRSRGAAGRRRSG